MKKYTTNKANIEKKYVLIDTKHKTCLVKNKLLSLFIETNYFIQLNPGSWMSSHFVQNL